MKLAITGVVLAGGQGRRMGSVDKGLQILKNKPMVEWVLQRFSPQVDEILINANRNIDQYARYGYRVISDKVKDFSGPLAGLQRALTEATHDLVATVPCDSPFLPTDLIARLREALENKNADITVAKTGEQAHPVFCLCKRSLASHLNEFLASGGRKIDAWYASLKLVEVNFEDEAAFSNINTLQELAQFESSPR